MRSVRPLLALTGTAVVLALTVTACGPGEDKASDKPSDKPAASSPADSGGADGGSDAGGDSVIPSDLADKLKKHGVDPEKWKNGEWKNWDQDKWLREAKDFVNPVIEGLWKPERMKEAKDPSTTMSAGTAAGVPRASDPEPRPVRAVPEKTPYSAYSAAVGKVFFDSPQGSMVCSGTVVKDPKNPGRSNLVWTAGHCVHAGKKGGWYRNIAFVPSYNNKGKSQSALNNAAPQEIAPYGVFWANWASTSGNWIKEGGRADGKGVPYDYAVLSVKPERGSKSLEQTVGIAMDVAFNAPDVRQIGAMGAWGYPAAPPYNGLLMHKCVDRPGRLSISSDTPSMYRIGCTMTGGSSGGGWFMKRANGKLALVSNTSIGKRPNGWLAGPQLGRGAQQIYSAMGDK